MRIGTEKSKKDPKDLEQDTYDEELVTKSLGKVGKGAFVLFVGTILGLIIGFAKRVLIARFYTPADYGMFNLYLTILAIFSTIGILGLKSGIPRNIAYYLGKNKKRKVSSIISWGLMVGAIGGIISGISLFLFSPYLAPLFSDNSDLIHYFKIAGITTPFLVLLLSLVSISRGFQRTKEKILFQDLGRNTLLLISVILIGLLGYSFDKVIIASLISIALIAFIFLLYYLKKTKMIFDFKGSFDVGIGKKLLLFSIPLLFVDIMFVVMGWGDTMLIGYYLTEKSVGFYNVARPLSAFISTGLGVTLFIYTPLSTAFYAQNKFEENKIVYAVLTKWICVVTLPLALIFVIFPGTVIRILFGREYLAAAIPLQILATAYFVNNLMGPNGATLMAYGKTRFLMFATGGAAILNIILNILLIPHLRITGAAIATGISLISVNTIRVIELNRLSGIHSLTSNTLKPISLTLVISIIIGLFFKNVISISIYFLIIIFVLFILIFVVSMLMTKSVSKEDVNVLLLVEKRTGLNLVKIKQTFRRFI